MLDPKQDTNAKVINAFLKILVSELNLRGSQDITKAEFMNESMMVYTKRKTEIDTLARTYENLNQNESYIKVNQSSRISPRPTK